MQLQQELIDSLNEQLRTARLERDQARELRGLFLTVSDDVAAMRRLLAVV